MSVVYFLLLLGAVVAIHEFGHFVAAKLLDFHVTRFSLGFGRPLFRVRAGETEYQVSWIPLGGSVQILGEDPSQAISAEDAPRAFHAKPLWQKLVVAFAGPAANLVLPVAIYFTLFVGHTELPAAVIGDVIAGSPADRAGLEPGDRIETIDGESVRYWEDVELAIQDNVGRELRIGVRRGDKVIEKYLVPIERTMRRRDMTTVRHGLAGISWRPFLPQVGVVDTRSPAWRAGIRTGDRVVSIDGKQIESFSQLSRELNAAARRMNVAVLRPTPVPGLPHVTMLEPHLADLVVDTEIGRNGRARSVHGIFPAELVIARVDPGSPADVAGLRPGDLVRTIDGEPIRHWMELDQSLQARPDKLFTLTWQRSDPERGAIELSAEITQVRQSRTDEYGHKAEVLAFGCAPDFERGEGELIAIDRRIAYATSKAIERTGETIDVMASGFRSILRGRSPGVGGPYMMYRVAAVSGSQGWEAFLLMIALVSVSVGLINLLPIPLFDGGQVVLFAIEAVRRRPITTLQRDWITVVGFAMVAVLTILALTSDVMRYLF